MQIKFIEDVREAWRFWSLRLLAVWSSALAAWPMLSDEQRAGILGLLGVTPEQMIGVVALSMFVSITVARVAHQGAGELKDKEGA